MAYKRYEKYKDSGIEWVGEVPISWSKSKISWSFKVIGSGGTPKSSNEKYYNDGNINWLLTGDLNDSFITETSKKVTELAIKENSTLKEFKENSLVVAMYGATIGKLGITQIKTTTNQACCVMSEPIDTNVKYMYYWFLGNRNEIINLSQGGGQPNISQNIVKGLVFYKPSIDEQNKISDFLDKKTIEIDSLIKEKEKLIKLLKEQRQAIITEAVTKGLDKNVKMKDSGVEWIGQIPEHWNVTYLKHIASRDKYSIVDGPFGSDMKNEEYVDCGVPIIQLNNIGEGVHKLTNLKFVTEEKAESLKRHSIYAGEIVIAKMMPAGRATIVAEKYPQYIVSSDSIRLKLNKDNDYRFIVHALNIYATKEANMQSTGTTRSRINLSIVKNFKIVCPNIEEQKEIADFIERKILEIDNIIDEVKSGINNLKEYKQSLISEAVTGKIDVRNI